MFRSTGNSNSAQTCRRSNHSRPAVIQQPEWSPQPLGPTSRTDTVHDVVFTSYNGELFRAVIRGMATQLEWALRMRFEVNSDFEHVAGLFRSRAATRRDEKRADTDTKFAIVWDKRVELMGQV